MTGSVLDAKAPALPARALPVWFGAERHELFGFYHAPRAPSRRMAIVLCNPFGYEAMCTHRAYRHLAQLLSSRGFGVLRFDYHGTGNSSGSDHDPDRVAAWLGSVTAAIDEVKQLSGCKHVGVFGARLGASLALLAAADRSDVFAFALWAPCLTGKAFLREELAVHKLRAVRHVIHPASDAAPKSPHSEALGFLLSAQTVAELRALSVSHVRSCRAQHALVLTRDAPNDEQRVAEHVRSLSVAVECEVAGGYPSMLERTHVPTEVWARVASGFERAEAALPPPALRGHLHAPRRCAEAWVWDAHDSAQPVRETAVFFGPRQRLFGVLTHPSFDFDPKLRKPPPTVLLLNAGSNHHVGTNRMHTRWARAWATHGVTTLRFDLAGLGDSVTGDVALENQLYGMDAIPDVCAAMDHVERLTGQREFALIGLCAGAFAAFHTGLTDPRVVSVALLNLLRFYWAADGTPERIKQLRRRQFRSLHYYRAMARRSETWQRLLRAELDLPTLARRLSAGVGRRLNAKLEAGLERITGTTAPRTRLAGDFRALTQRGVACLVVYNGDDPALDDFHEQLGAEERRLRASGTLRLELFDGADHIFTPLWSQTRLTELLQSHLQIQTRNPAENTR